MVHRTDTVGHLAGFLQIRRPLEPHGKGVELRPPCRLLSVRLDSSVSILLGHSRNDGTVEPSREEHAIGHVTHHLTADRAFEGIAKMRSRLRFILHVVIVLP